MDSDPVELEPGVLGCPSCKIPLVDGLTPFYYDGKKIGDFDGMICKTCGYGLLTDKGFEDSDKAISDLKYIESQQV